MTLYILKYNNYYNRMYKRELTVADYTQASNAVNFTPYILTANFNPNDNVNTEHIIGTGDYDGNGDYFLAVDANGQIVSRWFIVESVRTRGGQYKLYLHRDVVADFYDNFRSKPAFIEKGIANDDSVLIYNKENFTTNQIKTSETLLKDETNCPWLVGYIARKSEQGHTSLSGQFTPSINPDYKVTEMSELPFYSDIGRTLNGFTEDTSIMFTYGFSAVFVSSEVKNYKFNYNRQLSTEWLQSGWNDYFALSYDSQYPNNEVASNILMQNYETLFVASVPALLSIESKQKTEEIKNYSGRVVQQGDKFYRILVEETPYNYSQRYSDSEFPVGYEIAKRILTEEGIVLNSTVGKPVTVSATGTKYVISLKELEVDVNQIYHWELPVDRVHLQDAPYDMFCMPYGSIDVGSVTTDKDLNMSIMNDILSESVVGAGGLIYDAQILPYCPLPTDIVTGTTIELEQFPTTNYYSSIVKGTGESATTVGYIFFLTSSSFNVIINESISITNKKIQSETDLHRLCSPNYNGMFDFNAAMNNGVDYFIAECTYLPFTPYIHVKPNFKNLYGTFDFPDARGLICNGDFSLPVANSAWNQYKLQNKNYNEIFKRQIRNLEIQHEYQGWQDLASAITGTIGGALSGMAVGSMIPGVGTGIGMAVGGLGGAAVSGIGGGADIFINKALRTEALNYAHDLHNAQLGNIKAVPDSLTRVSAFTINNRLYPVLEYYTCSDEEKRALANKIAYNGMQINVIDTFENYAGRTWSYTDSTTTINAKNYVKCKLIRCEDLFEDTHLLNSLSDELNRGVYLQ